MRTIKDLTSYIIRNWRRILFDRGFMTGRGNCAEILLFFILGLIFEWIYDQKPFVFFGVAFGPFLTNLVLIVLTFFVASVVFFRRDRRETGTR